MARSDAIGAGSVLLTCNADQLNAGLDKAAKDVGRWAKQVEQTAARIGGGAAAGAGGSAGVGILGTAFGSALGMGKLGPLAAGAGGALASIGTVTAAMGKLKDVGDTLRTGEVFGVDPEKWSGMAGLVKSFGGGVRELSESIVTQGKLAEDALAGIPSAAAAFQKLKLDPKQFKTLDAADQFYTLFDAISRIESPTDRVRAAMMAWGEDGGKNLLPLIGKTGGELRQMAGAFALTAEQADRARQANVAVAKAGTLLEATWQRAAIAMAPAIEVGAKLVERSAPVFDWLGRAAERTVLIYAEGAAAIGAGIAEVADSVARWAGSIIDLGTDWPTVESVITEGVKGLALVWAAAFDAIRVGVGATAVGVGTLAAGLGDVIHRFRDVADVVKELPVVMRPFWFDAFHKNIDLIEARTKGAGAALQSWGRDQIAAWGTGTDKVLDFFDRILAKKGAAKPIAGLLGGAGPIQEMPKLGGAFEKGSAEAYRSTVKWSLQQQTAGMGVPSADPAKRLVDIQQQALQLLRQLVGKPPVAFDLI